MRDYRTTRYKSVGEDPQFLYLMKTMQEAQIGEHEPGEQGASIAPPAIDRAFQVHWDSCDEPSPTEYSLGAVAEHFKDDVRLVDVVNKFAALPLHEYLKDTDALWCRVR